MIWNPWLPFMSNLGNAFGSWSWRSQYGWYKNITDIHHSYLLPRLPFSWRSNYCSAKHIPLVKVILLGTGVTEINVVADFKHKKSFFRTYKFCNFCIGKILSNTKNVVITEVSCCESKWAFILLLSTKECINLTSRFILFKYVQ